MAIKKSILVVGGDGFIGSWLCDLLSKDFQVSTFDINALFGPIEEERALKFFDFRKKVLLKNTKKFQGDVREYKQISKVIEKVRPDIIIHLSSIAVENYKDESEQLATEVMGIFNVIKANAKIGARIVYMSSSFAIGHFDYATTEKASLEPQTNYGIGKATGEFLVKSMSKNYGIVRTTSVYGFGDVNFRVPQIVIENLLSGKNFWINKSALLDFIYVRDLVDGIKKVALYKDNGIFNISGGKARTIVNFTDVAKSIIGKESSYEIRMIDDRTRRGTLTNDKARLILQWEPQYGLEKGIEEVVGLYKKYPLTLKSS